MYGPMCSLKSTHKCFFLGAREGAGRETEDVDRVRSLCLPSKCCGQDGVGRQHIDVSALLLTEALYFRKWPWAGQTCTWPEQGSLSPCSEPLAPAVLHDVTLTKAVVWVKPLAIYGSGFRGWCGIHYQQWETRWKGSAGTHMAVLYLCYMLLYLLLLTCFWDLYHVNASRYSYNTALFKNKMYSAHFIYKAIYSS